MSVNISAAQVKQLRDQTSAGMMECKKALIKSEGDLDKAVKILRESGLAKAAKRDGRKASEGLINIVINDGEIAGAMADLCSETDFVARNEEFQAVAKSLADTAMANKVNDLETLKTTIAVGFEKDTDEVVGDIRAKIGEKIESTSVAYVEGDVVTGYIHPPGKIGVLVAAKLDGANASDDLKETLRGVAMHIAAVAPRFLNSDEVDQKTLEGEREVFTNIAKKEGKPENIIQRIVDGKINSFYKDNCLLNQVYVKDNKATIATVLEEAGKAAGGKVEIARFVRFQIG
jgi:elongation factor Ts